MGEKVETAKILYLLCVATDVRRGQVMLLDGEFYKVEVYSSDLSAMKDLANNQERIAKVDW